MKMLPEEAVEDGIQGSFKQRKRKALATFLDKIKKRKLVKTGGGEKGDENNEEKKESFTVLGRYTSVKTGNVQHHLPDWLAKPNLISSDLKGDQCPIEELNVLNETLLGMLRSNNIQCFFPVQKAVIPHLIKDSLKFGLSNTSVMRPSDVCVSAPTGSGKTLAYILPIVHCLHNRIVPKIRALVLVPVQELAIQVTNVFKLYCKSTSLNVGCASGKTPLHIEQSNLIKVCDESLGDYESLVDILVTTPGRLVEHLGNSKGFNLQYLRFLVIDEADRMVDNIQNNWLYHLDKHINSNGTRNISQLSLKELIQKKKNPQKLLFSATLSQDPEMLKRLNLFQPILYSTVTDTKNNPDKTDDYIGSFATPLELKEKYIIVETALKPLVLCELFRKTKQNVLCFTKSAKETHKLSELLSILNPELKVSEISSLLPPDQREKIITDFSTGLINVLVCSDVMARGVDISGVKYVISYDPPKHIKGYIHRVGRTGRAGMKGKAITLLSQTQASIFNQMLLDVNKNDVKQMAVDEENLKKMLPKYKTALQELKEVLKKEDSKHHQEEKKEKEFSNVKKKSKRKSKKNKSIGVK